MEKELNLVEILKGCPRGTKLYSPLFGEVEFCLAALGIQNKGIVVAYKNELGDMKEGTFYGNGNYDSPFRGECLLFPSKDQQDWSKFVLPKPDLPNGAWVMCQNCGDGSDWKLRRYSGNNRTYDGVFRYTWNYIIPFDNFDPNNIEECIKKYNYGTKQ